MSDVKDTEAIERSLTEGMQQSSVFGRPRPVVVAKEDRTREAMQEVDRKLEAQALQIEAFIDMAINQRVMMVRGVFMIGPREMHIRAMVLKAIQTIEANNSHSLDP